LVTRAAVCGEGCMTGRLNTCWRSPRSWSCATCPSVSGWIRAVRRASTAAAGGAPGVRLLRSRAIARGWRTVLVFFGARVGILRGGMVLLIPL